ncbi:MAG: hypothetical protein IH984_06415 [Planctomycetes bacterium]|nr:hypothetical protein [Planctomycetota bacterium]
MQYSVTGENRETGRSLDITVEATNETDAAQQVIELGLVVSKITPLPDEQINTLSEAIAGISDLNRRPPLIPGTQPPRYFWLTILGQLYFVSGGALFVLFVIGALVYLFVAIFSTGETDSWITTVDLPSAAIWGLGGLAVGQLLLGFRDMARNSWHLPELARLTRASYIEQPRNL